MDKIKIREIREGLELTQAEFAQKLYVSSATIYNWEAGNTKPSRGNVKRIKELKEA